LKLEQECKLTNASPEEHDALQLLQQVNMLSARIPGFQVLKIFVRNEICSYYRYFGLPHIFFTFNPSLAHSPIFQVMFSNKTVDLSERFPVMPVGCERTLILAQDPVATADFFEFSFRALFHFLLGWDFNLGCSVADGGIFGFICAFYGTSEFTERGLLHGHFLIWLEGGLNPLAIHDCLCALTKYQSHFFEFFEQIIHHHLPDTEDVIDPKFEPCVQCPLCLPDVHAPLEVMEQWEAIYITEIKRCGEVLQHHRCHPVCHKYGNDNCCHFLFLHEIVEASLFDPETNSVVLMCCDANVNYFNPYILVFCRHNHDIKCILSS